MVMVSAMSVRMVVIGVIVVAVAIAASGANSVQRRAGHSVKNALQAFEHRDYNS